MSVPLTLRGFDVSTSIERMLGQPELWWQTVVLFVQHYSDWERDWLAVRGDDEAERKKVHALRSAAANVGANKLSCAAAVLEELMNLRISGKPVEIPSSVRWYLQDCFHEAWGSASDAWLRDSLAQGK